MEMMWSQTASSSLIWASSCPVVSVPQVACSYNVPQLPLNLSHKSLFLRGPANVVTFAQLKTSCTRKARLIRASVDDAANDTSPTLLLEQDPPNKEVEQSVQVLKNAAKTRKVSKNEVLSALSVIEKANLDPSKFLQTLGGSESPGRTWMLIFTAEKKLKDGRYFPITAVQRFDAEAKRIENGVFFGALGNLTFEGGFSWKKRILAFMFERIRVKIGPFNPLDIKLGNQDNREPNTKDPFFIWFYVDEEIAVARGRSGGTAFWCRCRRVTSP